MCVCQSWVRVKQSALAKKQAAKLKIYNRITMVLDRVASVRNEHVMHEYIDCIVVTGP